MNRGVRWAEYAIREVSGGRFNVQLRRTPVDLEQNLEAARDSKMPHLQWWAGRWDT